jgi:hypothetical protein
MGNLLYDNCGHPFELLTNRSLLIVGVSSPSDVHGSEDYEQLSLNPR